MNNDFNRHMHRAVRGGLIAFLSALFLSSCGLPLFSPAAVASASFTAGLRYDGEGKAYSGNNYGVDASQYWFIPSRNYAIDSEGVSGVLLDLYTGGVAVSTVAPDPSLADPTASELREVDSLSQFSAGGALAGRAGWSFDMLAGTSVPAGTDYAGVIIQSGALFYVDQSTFPTASASASLVSIDGGVNLGSVMTFTGWTGSAAAPTSTGITAMVGESIGFDPTAGLNHLYVLLQDANGYWAGDYTYDLTLATPITSATPAELGSVTSLPLTIPDAPTAGKYLYDPSTGRSFLTYAAGGSIKTVTWTTASAAVTEIPVHQFPEAVFPGGYLYAESDGTATVYDSTGALVGTKAIGAVRFAHVVADDATGAPRLVFSHVFVASENGENVFYFRVYSTLLSDFLSSF